MTASEHSGRVVCPASSPLKAACQVTDSDLPQRADSTGIPDMTLQLPTHLPATGARCSSPDLQSLSPNVQISSPLRRSSSQQLLTASTELMKIATGPALRTVMGGAVGMVNWASGYSRKPSTTGSEICRMSKEPNICHVELMVLENVKERLMMDNTMSVASLHQHVQRRTGLPPARQCLVISEDRARRQGFSQTVWRAKTQMSSVRQDMRAAIINSINFVFLPEMFNRELNGRGMISFVKSTGWYQSLQEAHYSCAVQAAESVAAPANATKVRIEQLSGQVLVFEVDLSASLQDLKLAVQQRLGIMVEQQRMIILEKQETGALTYATNAMLLQLFRGLRKGIGVAAKLTNTLLNKAEATYPVTLHSTAGRQITVTVNGDATVNQMRLMLEKQRSLLKEEDLSAVTFPPHLPPLRAQEPKPQIIRTAVM